jgi:hypothetical protein
VPNSGSSASEWITPYAGETSIASGWYVYATKFRVPSILPRGIVPTSVTLNGRISSDNATFAFYMQSPASTATCSMVTGLPVPITSETGYTQWTDFSFNYPVTAGAEATLFVVVSNQYDTEGTGGDSPSGLRVEFFDSSSFN